MFKGEAPAKMFAIVSGQVFPFLRDLGGEESTYSGHMKDARFTIPTPSLLSRVVDMLDDIPMVDRDTNGDLYEYRLGKIASAGQNGQFRTPRDIIQLMVEMMAPTRKDLLMDAASSRHFNHKMFHGYDFDSTMLRIGSMNMLLHGIEEPDIRYRLVARFRMTLPSIAEQKRITRILNLADVLRAQRHQTFAHLEELKKAAFDNIFIDTRPAQIQRTRVGELLSQPLRNGLSPSSTGTVKGRVLTLSAITGFEFKPSAIKEARFSHTPAQDQRVRKRDLLICRGNGNLSLVGKGFVPINDEPEIAYPDTIIAATFDETRIQSSYLQYTWNSESVRRQIEASARTTNGPFKINQSAVENIILDVPSLKLQNLFQERMISLQGVQSIFRKSLDSLDEAFDSIQQQAFAGHLS